MNLCNYRTLSAHVGGSSIAESDEYGDPIAHTEVVVNLPAEGFILPLFIESGEEVIGIRDPLHISSCTDTITPNEDAPVHDTDPEIALLSTRESKDDDLCHR